MEDAARRQPADERRRIRQVRAGPLLGGIKGWLEATLPRISGKSELATAIRYALSRWAQLTRYRDDGRLEIDNNYCENAIRPTAVGKKNFLFIGHPDAGQRSAVLYSVLGSCRRHGINPAEYLHDVFERLPKAKTSEVKSLTPAAWAKARRNGARPSP